MAVAWWVCPCNHSTQEAEAVQLLWLPAQPGINTKMFYLNKRNKRVNKWEHRSRPRNLRIARKWAGLGTGVQIWSSKGMGTFCRGNTRAEQSLESLREWQPQDWVKSCSGAASSWPVLPVREAVWGRWGCPVHSSAPAYVPRRHHQIDTEWIHLSFLNFSYLSTQAEIHLLLGVEKGTNLGNSRGSQPKSIWFWDCILFFVFFPVI